jgi:hypothetical protein
MPRGGYVGGGIFADGACTQPAFEVSDTNNCDHDGRDTFLSYMQAPATLGCGATALFPRFGSAAQISTIYYAGGGSCRSESVSNENGYSFYGAKLPDEIPPTSFASILIASREAAPPYYHRRGGRLRLMRSVASGDQGYERVDDLVTPFDTSRKSGCFPAMLADGNTYCIDAWGYFAFDGTRGNYFADSGCVEPVFGVDVTGASCDAAQGLAPSTLFSETPTTNGTCEVRRLYHVPAEPLANPTLYTKTAANTCVLANPAAPPGYAFYRRSDCTEAMPDEFVRLTVSLTK